MVKDGQNRILRYLIENQDKQPSIKRIAETLHLNYKSAHQGLEKLRKAGVVKLTQIGNSRICSFVPRPSPLVFEVEYERRKDLIKNKDFLAMYSRMALVSQPYIAVIFGSQAKGAATVHSDIDILLITDSEQPGHELRLLPFKIHTTEISPKEFGQMLKSREFTVVSEAVKKNLILIGIEDYYRLIANARHETNQEG